MDSQTYKTAQSKRGYTYSYYHHAPSSDAPKPYILFLHGFPSTSHDWEAQVVHFAKLGYGILAPDLLGYGRSSKPDDYREYKAVNIATDLVAILEAENVKKVIVVGHDWGSMIASCFVDACDEYVLAAAFLAVGYTPPNVEKFDLDAIMARSKQHFGSELLGYWGLLTAEDGPALIEKNLDSAYDLFFPIDPEVWKTDVAPRGKTREWVESNKRVEGSPSYLDEKARREHQKHIMESGFAAPCKYYLCTKNGVNDSTAPRTEKINKPTFLGAALRDYVCLAVFNKAQMSQHVNIDKMTVQDFDTSHWVMLEKPDEVNAALEKFFVAAI
jgi:soluble epoxide hydrolase/lipid-phosphate phosphatase